jgi:poly(3-hydroxybutyrate) depolymerase
MPQPQNPPISRRPAFDVTQTVIGRRVLAVRELSLAERPFSRLLRFACPDSPTRPPLLLVAPLSNTSSYVMRDAVAGLLPTCDVHLLEWRDARDAPVDRGPFGMDENIDDILCALRALPPGTHLLGLCQAVPTALAAAALLAQAQDAGRPASLTLISGPADPRVNPTRMDELIRLQPLAWLESFALTGVPAMWPGAGRRVYAADTQRPGVMAYLSRHVASGGELRRKTVADDGDDPAAHPFMAQYMALVDVPGEAFIDTMRLVFHEAALPKGRLRWRGVRVEPDALERTPLLTVEGEEDDISGPGQTAAAHDMIPGLPADLRARHVQSGVGHFGSFHGAAWRRDIVPLISSFINRHAPSA